LTVGFSAADSELGMVTFSSTSSAIAYKLYSRAQFARRDSVYYQSISAKAQDAFVIVCTITSASSPTTLLPPASDLSVPKTLIDTVGSLLDDPLYSDVEFVIMRPQNPQKVRRIWASRKLLQRAEHFNDSEYEILDISYQPTISFSVLGTNFAEGTMDNVLRTPRPAKQSLVNLSSRSENGVYSDEYIDSDDEDDHSDGDNDDDDDDEVSSQMDTAENEFAHILGAQDGDSCLLPEIVLDDSSHELYMGSRSIRNSVSGVDLSGTDGGDLARQSHKSRLTVAIKDVAYNTYRALLYYVRVVRAGNLYTDTFSTHSCILIILSLLLLLRRLTPRVSPCLRPLARLLRRRALKPPQQRRKRQCILTLPLQEKSGLKNG
jgi:hypothetical protein